MKSLTLLLLLVSSLSLASGTHGDHKKMDHSKNEKMAKPVEHAMHGKKNKKFNKVLKTYEELHQAFFDNDNKKVKEQAKKVLRSIEKVKDKKIIETLTFSKKKLNEIIKSDSLEDNQKSFNTISQGLLVVVEKHAPNKDYARYYCPMVKKYWIQNISKSEKVMNPYASESMPHCGAKK